MKKIYLTIKLCLLVFIVQAQKEDTVIVELGNTSKVVFTIGDKADLDILKHYDFQGLFEEIIHKLEVNDTTSTLSSDSVRIAGVDDPGDTDDDNDDGDDNDNGYEKKHGHRRLWRNTWQSFNFDLGTNNYLKDGKFPDDDNALYTVKPWGSWYVGLNSIQRVVLGKRVFLDWGLGVSWYNFKFQNSNTLITDTESGVVFTEDERDVDFIKSKLTATYINASLIPIFDLGKHDRESKSGDKDDKSLRIGLGPYVGYRIASHSKLVYEDDGREGEKDRDNFYLNNFRYGVRLQLGFRSTGLFFNYDLNELFAENKGPKLNAFSFGVIL